MRKRILPALLLVLPLMHVSADAEQVRARDLGIAPGVLATGKLNSITDVAGVRVGQVTLHNGKDVHTGVTAIIPAEGNLRQRKVPAAVYVGNGYGKMAGISQIRELGEIETPVVLTNTLNVAEGIAGVVEWTLAQPGNEDVASVNAVVGETNDGFLNDIRRRTVTKADVIQAINTAQSGSVAEGNNGAGSGTRAFGWKGGIGTSSRLLPALLGGYTVGVLVQSNFGGILNIDGLKVGEALNQHYLYNELNNDTAADGSIMIVVATDAPLDDRNLERLAKRAMAGVARTGASLTNGSGDYVIAFSNADALRRDEQSPAHSSTVMANSQVSPLFEAVIEATQEAIYNSLLMAEDVEGFHGSVKALPVDKIRSMLPAEQGTTESSDTLRVATFNVSMESTNYPSSGLPAGDDVLKKVLSDGNNPQVKNIAEIIQRTAPDIILLNEFDYIKSQSDGVRAFIQNYLNVSQHGQPAIDYPYVYLAPVNTGEPSPFDLDNDGKATGTGGDAWGFGLYPGQYGMVVLSKYPVVHDQVHSLQTFKWKDMPGAQKPVDPATDTPWYNEEEWAEFRLSSKSHWDIPVKVNGRIVHVLAMHPTPPNFDGDEDRNGKRNHDEIRLMADYLSPDKGEYITDDEGKQSGLPENTHFVLAGDFNAADAGDKHRPGVIEQLIDNRYVNGNVIPESEGGREHSTEPYSRRFTAHWGARADYVLPSRYGFEVTGSGVFWPEKASPLYRLVKDREASSDHRLVWLDVRLTGK